MANQAVCSTVCVVDGASVDYSTSEGLKQALDAVLCSPKGWHSRLGRELMAYVAHRLGGLAHSVGCDPSEAASYAWELFRDGLTDSMRGADDLWAYVARAVSFRLSDEAEAARKLTSTRTLRREHTKAVVAVERWDTEAAPSAPALRWEGPAVSASEDAAPTTDAMIFVEQLLVMGGVGEAERCLLIDQIVSRVERSVSIQAAVDGLCRIQNIAGFGITPAQWRALVTLVLGSSAGHPGLLRLVAEGKHARSVPFVSSRIQKMISTPSVAA